MDFLSLNASVVFQKGLVIKGYSCSDVCASFATCGECTMDPRCGWCGSAGCQSAYHQDCAANQWTAPGECCPACTGQTECATCSEIEGCAWSYDRGQCLSGTEASTLCEDSVWTRLYDPSKYAKTRRK